MLPQSDVRSKRIRILQDTIKESLIKNNLPRYALLIKVCGEDWGVSEKTAKEYVKQAMFNTSTAQDNYGFIVEREFKDKPKLSN